MDIQALANKRLLEVLKINRYSTRDLAKAMKLSYVTVYKKLNNQIAYNYNDICNIGKFLGKKNANYIFLDVVFEK